MSRSSISPRLAQLAALLIERRTAAGLTQMNLAAKLGKRQSLISDMEAGRRRIDVFEFLDLARAIGFDPVSTLDELNRSDERTSE